MFEDKTFENLLQAKLDTVDSKRDKREGSIIWDALAPNSAEDAQVYIVLEWMFAQQHGETAERENLIQIAYDTRGIIPYGATYAELKGEFDVDIEIGSRFSLGQLNYTATEQLGENTYRMQCETIGTQGNRQLGTLIPINYIAGLTKAELTEVLVYARDEEETEAFRQRWRDSFHSTAFGGNKADYKKKIKEIAGVGGVKIERATNPAGELVGGYVRCTVITSDYGIPTSELVEEIQTLVDPEVNHGEGDGLAPIGAVATCNPVVGVTVNVSATLTYDAGYSYDALKSKLEKVVDDYFLELRKTWEDTNGLIVRIARIESDLYNVDGVIDISNLTLNGEAANIFLDDYSIPLRGSVNG